MYTMWISQRVSGPAGGAVWNEYPLAYQQSHFSVCVSQSPDSCLEGVNHKVIGYRGTVNHNPGFTNGFSEAQKKNPP